MIFTRNIGILLKILLCENGKFGETFVKVTLDVERPSCVDPFAVGYSVLMQFFSCYSNNNRSIYSIVLCGTTFGEY